MSLQDDIFDIQEALKRKPPEREAFNRVCSALYSLEEDADKRDKLLSDLVKGAVALRKVWEASNG